MSEGSPTARYVPSLDKATDVPNAIEAVGIEEGKIN